jgi:uncharacterized protein (UPF0261 family)
MMQQSQSRFFVIIGTLDTKGPEIAFLRGCFDDLGCHTRIIDVGLLSRPAFAADIPREAVAARMNTTIARLVKDGKDKVQALTLMAQGAGSIVQEWVSSQCAAGVIALGGGVGTWLGTTVMRNLPLGLPKVMVTTLPYDIRPLVGAKDIIFFPSVADILGLNPTLRTIIRNAASALATMADLPQMPATSKPVIGLTGMGITTPSALACRKILEKRGYEIASFHTNGFGGSAFEEWVQMGMFDAVLDLTTHEITSQLFNGVAKSVSTRLETAAKKGLPQVVGPGGLDVVSRGPIETLSKSDLRQLHHRHSPFFTHVRISADGMRSVAETIADKLNLSRAPTAFIIPLKGFSTQNFPGGIFYNPEADSEFIFALKKRLKKEIKVVEIDCHINDIDFAEGACNLLEEITQT